MGALAADRQAPAVPDALVATDLDLAADVRGDFASKVTFDAVVALDPVTQLDQVVIGQVADANVGADAGLGQRLERTGAPDAKDVGERNLNPLVAGQVDANETCLMRACSLSFTKVSRVTVPIARWGPGLRAGGAASLRTQDGTR